MTTKLLSTTRRWLLVGAGVELAINAWAMFFVARLGVCSSETVIMWRCLVALQAAMLVMLVAFVIAVVRGGAPSQVGWISSAFFAVGLLTATTMRVWIRRVPPVCRLRIARVSDLEYGAVDAVNWLALAAFALKLIGFAVSLAIATRLI
jgi:hypothetical protein